MEDNEDDESKGSLIAWVTAAHGYASLTALLATGAVQVVLDGDRECELPDLPDEGEGLFRWEGTVTPMLKSIVFAGTWRRLTPSEAVVLVTGENPLTHNMSDVFDAYQRKAMEGQLQLTEVKR